MQKRTKQRWAEKRAANLCKKGPNPNPKMLTKSHPHRPREFLNSRWGLAWFINFRELSIHLAWKMDSNIDSKNQKSIYTSPKKWILNRFSIQIMLNRANPTRGEGRVLPPGHGRRRRTLLRGRRRGHRQTRSGGRGKRWLKMMMRLIQRFSSSLSQDCKKVFLEISPAGGPIL